MAKDDKQPDSELLDHYHNLPQWEEQLINTADNQQAIDVIAPFAEERPILVGLVGFGIQKSRSPAMHEAEGTAQNLRYTYRLIDTEVLQPKTSTLSEIVRAAGICGFAGLNITYPYKIEIVPHLDEVSETVKAVGAVNTVVFRNGKRIGHNTDHWGFAEGLRRNMTDAARDHVLLIGAGGAGAAVAHALVACSAGTVWIADIDPGKAEFLAERICNLHGGGRARAVADMAETAAIADGVVNATPVGMAHLPGMPIPEALIRPDMWGADIIYFPLDTALLRVARARGCRTLSGAGMAVFQAVRAFKLFTGLDADARRMEATFRSFDQTAPD